MLPVIKHGKLENLQVRKAIVDEVKRKNECCRVRFDGSYWWGRAINPFEFHQGDLVQVVGRDNISLLIEPISVNYKNEHN